MIRSFVAICSLVSMAGLVAMSVVTGCSSDDAQTATSATEPEEVSKKTPPKAPTQPTTPDEGDTDDGISDQPSLTCMDTKPFDATTVPYNPPNVTAGSCTAADVKVFEDFIQANPQASFEEVEAALTKQSQRCSQCVFGAADDAKWAPVVSDGTNVTFNGGGCVSVVSGKDACGKAYQQWNTCLNTVCASCTDQNENSQCKNDAQGPKAACGAASNALFQACGRNVNDYLKTCFGNGIGGVLQQICGTPTPPKDGGA